MGFDGSEFKKRSSKKDKKIKGIPAKMKHEDVNAKEKKIQNEPKKVVNLVIVASVVVAILISFAGFKLYTFIEKNKADKQFSVMVSSISADLIQLAIESESVVDDISEAWREAIFDKKDDGDFNIAIRRVYRERIDTISKIKELSDNLGSKIKSMDVMPEKDREYNRLKQIYLLFSQYADLATSPSGNLRSYSDKNSELKSEIKSAIKELEFMR